MAEYKGNKSHGQISDIAGYGVRLRLLIWPGHDRSYWMRARAPLLVTHSGVTVSEEKCRVPTLYLGK
jgi:hypothetical protein